MAMMCSNVLRRTLPRAAARGTALALLGMLEFCFRNELGYWVLIRRINFVSLH
jgi:hypothetical protein